MSLTVTAIHVHALNGEFKWMCCFQSQEALIHAKRSLSNMSDEQAILAFRLACQCNACSPCGAGPAGKDLPPGPAPKPIPEPIDPAQEDCVRRLIATVCGPTGRKALNMAQAALTYIDMMAEVDKSPVLKQSIHAIRAAVSAVELGCDNKQTVGAIASAICHAHNVVKKNGMNFTPYVPFVGPIIETLGGGAKLDELIKGCCNG